MTDKPYNPFADFDYSQFDIGKMMSDFKVPGVDMKAMMETQRKNIEALTAANRAAFEGMQTIAKRQTEMLAQAMAEISNVAQQLTSSANNPQEMSAKQAELVKQAFEKALANMRELAEMVNKANTEAFEVINKRFTESLEEVKSMVITKK